MRLLIYEWVTGGGLVGSHGALPESLLREGLAMARAAAADSVRAGARPVLLQDLRLPQLSGVEGEVIEVTSRSDHDAVLERLARECDAALVIAPETDGALLATTRRLEEAGASLLSPTSAFIKIATDKQRTAEALAADGVPVPEGVVVEPDSPLPKDAAYPAVIKPVDGAGSQDTHLVAHALDRPPAYAWPRRLERHMPGVPASVAVIGVSGGEPVAMPPCRQRIAIDGRFAYLGGETPLAAGLAERATRLALSAVRAVGPLVGYAGVDLILGDDPNGSGDAVIEINPRLTTSYVGLRHSVQGGLVGPMLVAAGGDSPEITIDPRPLGWDADGAVYWA